MAITFGQASISATNNLNQANKQLQTANNLIGGLALSVTQQNVNKSENIYGQVNTFLGLATTSNNNAYSDIQIMAKTAVDTTQKQKVLSDTAINQDISKGIATARSQSQVLINQLNDTRYNEEYNVPRGAQDSAGEIVRESQQAADDDARVQNPPPPFTTFDDAGNEVPVTSAAAEESNATEPELLNTEDDELGLQDGVSNVGGDSPILTTRSTQGDGAARSDDWIDWNETAVGYSAGSEGGRPPVAPEFLQPINAQKNPLSGLSSMTYTISIYLMSDSEYKQLLTSQVKRLPTQQLILQSGGIDKTPAGGGVGQRNRWFDVDFYLDDVNIESVVGTQSGAKATSELTLDFTVIEPNGITFLNRLRNAIRDHSANKDPSVSELNANFLMVIRFYGYDSNGNLVNGSKLGIPETGSDPGAVVEKWIPFQVADIRYKISTKNVEYKIIATIPQTSVAHGQTYATIPFNFQLSAPDLNTLLNGKATAQQQATQTSADDTNTQNNTSPAAPPKASASSTVKTYDQGLCDALNQHYRNLVSEGQYEIAPQFFIELESVSGLADAKMAMPGTQDKARAPMNTANSAREKYLTKTAKYDKDTKQWSVTAGTQILQVIDLALRNSSYITSQANVTFDENTQEPIPQNPVSTVQWYRIRSRVEPLGYDKKQRNIVYKTIYTISRYQINTPRTTYYPPAAYRGAHKIYNWWFTGQNTEVLDFDIQVNANYVTTFGTGAPGLAENKASGRYFEKRAFQTRPNESSQGNTGPTTMPAATLAERLYSMADVETSVLTILGDPDWVQQTEVFYNKEINLQPFVRDGSVNYDASEVLYEIRFNPVADYNLSTGLAEVNANNTAYSQATGENNLAQESIVYAAQTVTSSFKGGMFRQKLRGTLRDFSTAFDRTGNQTATSNAATQNQAAPQTAAQSRTPLQQQGEALINNYAINTLKVPQSMVTPAPTTSSVLQADIVNEALGFNGSLATPKAGTSVVSDDAG